MPNKVGRDEAGERSTPKKRSRLRSEVWEHFTKIDNDTRAKCKYCNLDFSLKHGTTTHLKRHLRPCKKVPHGDGGITQPLTIAEDYERAVIDQPPTTSSEDVVRNVCVTQIPPMTASRCEVRNFGSTGEHPTTVFGGAVRNSCLTQEVDRENHVKNAILIDLPFLSPTIRKVWSSPMGIDMEKEIFEYHQREKDKLLTEFGRLTSRVCFSIKIMEKAGWISITAHFINSDFNLVTKLIGFKKLPDISSNLFYEAACIIESCISDWKLENKIFSFTTETTETHDFDVSLQKKFESKMLLGWDDLTSTCLKKMVGLHYYIFLRAFYRDRMNKIIKFVLGVMQCYAKKRKFNEIAKEKGLPLINEDWLKCRPIEWDVDTDHWKFCCAAVKMFKDASIYKEVFEQCVHAKVGEEPISELDLSDIDWPKLEKEVESFEVTKSIIDALSNFKYPTSNLRFESEMEVMMDRRMEDADDIFVVASVLDPRCNLTFLKYFMSTQKNKQRGYWRSDCECARIRNFLELIFREYAEEQTNQNSPRTENPSETIDKFSLYIKELKTSRIFEMEQYLAEEPIDIRDANFDLLGWWKKNRLRYPTWSRMARDVLATPACVYSVEENLKLDLSVLKGVSPELVEAAICSKDWILLDVPRPQEIVQRRNDKNVNADNAHHDSALEIPCGTSPISPRLNKTLEAILSISGNSQETQIPQPTLQKQLSENAQDEDEEKTKAAMQQVRDKNQGNFFTWVEVLEEIEPTVVIVKMEADPDNPIRLTRKQMDSLLCYSHNDEGAKWLSDQVIDAYINIINHERDPSHNKVLIVSTLDTRLLRGGMRTKCKTTSKIRELGIKFLNNDLIFFPINMMGVHWIVGVLNITKHEFQILDSNVMNYNPVIQSAYDFLACELWPGIQECIESVCDSNEVMQARANQFDKAMRNRNVIKTVPQQTDHSSCGLFALRYIQFWNGSDIPDMLLFSQWEMDIFRRQVAAELIKSELNLMKVVQQEIKQLSLEVRL